MSFIEHIPQYHLQMVKELGRLNSEKREANNSIEAHYTADEKGGHDCNCEYCPYADCDFEDILSADELEEREAQVITLDKQIAEQRRAIRALENYAALIKHPLPKDKLIK